MFEEEIWIADGMGGWRGSAAGARSASDELSCREDWSGWKHSDCWLLRATAVPAAWLARRCRAGLRASSLLINDWRLSQPPSLSFLFYIFLPPSPPCTSFTSQSPSAPYPSSQNIKLLFLLQSPFSCLSVCHCSLLIFPRIRHWFLLPVSLSPPARPITYNLCPTHSSTSRISFPCHPHFSPSSFCSISSSPSCLYISSFSHSTPTSTNVSIISQVLIYSAPSTRNGCHIYPPFCVKGRFYNHSYVEWTGVHSTS